MGGGPNHKTEKKGQVLESLFGHCFVVVFLSNKRWGICSRQFIATSAEVTPKGSLGNPTQNGGCGAAGKESRFQLGGKA